jgi:methylated-DNA-[protein]-cysteine S-methyltransferase
MNQPSTRRRTTIDSPIGTITLVAEDDVLVEVHLPNGAAGTSGHRPDPETSGHRPDPQSGDAEDAPTAEDSVLGRVSTQLREYFAGERIEFDVPLAPRGTPFQLAAWQALRTIPYGETVSYGEQARRLGDRNLARAVGAANGRNPLPIIVPCHRVVGANGHLTGFGGGIECTAWLLDHERAVRQRTA